MNRLETPDDPIETGPGAAVELRQFLAEALPAHRKDFGDSHDFTSRRAFQGRLAAGGWVGLTWPEEYGGRALGIEDRIACDLELALSAAPPLAGPLGVANVGPTVMVFGTPEQQSHLPAILDASEIWCQGFSEPDNGSDLGGLRTSARVTDRGFVVNGRKVWTTNGVEATHCMLLARTDPDVPKHRGISALLLRLDLPGIERRSIHQMDGGREFAEMTFDDVEVPASGLLGPLHDGWRVTMTTLANERAGVISQAAGLERDVLAEVGRLAGTTDVVLRHELVQRFIEGRVLGMLGTRVLSHLASNRGNGPEPALIRLAQGLLRQRLAETRVHGHGMAAVTEVEWAAGQELLTSRSASIAAGTREVLKNVVAERVLGLPRS
jgi:alkylation response protein AidB-like acyl-CoA dehydrogenase